MSERLNPKGTQTDEEESECENFTSNPHETTEAPQDGRIYTLLHPLAVWYFVFTGQWFDPVRLFLESKLNLTPSATKLCRSLYAAWQAIVVLFIWAFFVYSMGFMGLRTLKEVDWLCPLTDITNIAYGLCWIVDHHTGLLFFLMGNYENLLKRLTITEKDVRRRYLSSPILMFVVASFLFLFALPLGLHVTQMLIPDFIPVEPKISNGTISFTNKPFPHLQVTWDGVFFVAQRAFALPVFYAFLSLLFFLNCEVNKFKEELKDRNYLREHQARKRAIRLRNLIRDTEKAFQVFLTLYIVMLLLTTLLEIFSIVEKVETVITVNNTVEHFIPVSAATSSLKTMDTNTITAIPHRLTGKHSFPHVFVLVNQGNQSLPGTGGFGCRTLSSSLPNAKKVIDQYRMKTSEILLTAVLDITQNVVLYAIPLYQMHALKRCLEEVVEMVQDSDYDHQDANMKIFHTRQDKKDFKNFFKDTCISGIRVLGKEVSFLWNLVLTFFGPFVVVVVNLMFKHIHVETPWH